MPLHCVNRHAPSTVGRRSKNVTTTVLSVMRLVSTSGHRSENMTRPCVNHHVCSFCFVFQLLVVGQRVTRTQQFMVSVHLNLNAHLVYNLHMNTLCNNFGEAASREPKQPKRLDVFTKQSSF